ncbi:MAG TPA: hypothetical protein VL002_14600 [Candidimonas sp.]|nr:hypothetical protein [Candidimonas sp.]
MKRSVAAALLIVGIVYPFIVYFGLDHLRAAWLALPLALLWLARAIWTPATQPGGRILPSIAVAFCAAIAMIDSTAWLRAYPVLINAMLFTAFAASLRHGPPIIERLARLQHPNLPPEGVRYTRRVTQVWAGFFMVNGSIAAMLALWAPWSWWTAYNGGISYVMMGLLFLGEWLLRPASAQSPSPL